MSKKIAKCETREEDKGRSCRFGKEGFIEREESKEKKTNEKEMISAILGFLKE